MKQETNFDLGVVQVDNKVIADLALTAIKGIGGIKLAGDTVGEKILKLFGRQRFGGIDVKVDAQNNVSLEIRVIIHFGINIPDVARQIQDAVKQALDEAVDINLKKIDVHVQGIDRGKK